MNSFRALAAGALCGLVLLHQASLAEGVRHTFSLEGEWQIAEGGMDAVPEAFNRTVPVPGLVDMAEPPFLEPAPRVANGRQQFPQKDPRRDAFWYRRTFAVTHPIPSVARLKVHKAKYGTRVILNGQQIGDHAPCFTPGWFDIRSALREGENELLIRVGADREAVRTTAQSGFDREKYRYIPGIYDRVELILSETPHIVNVQTAPDVPGRSVRVVAEVANAGTEAVEARIRLRVREWQSGAVRSEGVGEPARIAPGGMHAFDVTMPIENCRLWSPEDPFLYTVEVDTGADVQTVRFGMRSFATDPERGVVLLNGKPYYMRGSNVTLYRFLEDGDRGALPWNGDWVRKLHRRFKDMHWNSLRYSIGLPPEQWYEIADEEGLLIQDEFPIWEATLSADIIAAEFTEWMRERWNHPCVVIWDAQNETHEDKALLHAIAAVRGLDLSNRPWDNGFGAPASPSDVTEYHPYRTPRWRKHTRPFSLSGFADESGFPDNGPKQRKPPFIINEYAWLWINRDGSLPRLTRELYRELFGENPPIEQRWRYYARTLAAKTEFWRGKRKCAGVLHFCALGYSRPEGFTSDNFVDVKNLEFEPHFFQYVRDAFAPVGLMIDAWADDYAAGATKEFPVVLINDRYEPWKGAVRFRLLHGEKVLAEQEQPAAMEALGTANLVFPLTIPEEPGAYTVEATLLETPVGPVSSLRDFSVPGNPEAQPLP